MPFEVEAAKRWNVQIAQLHETIRVAYTCPTCHKNYEINVQAGNWLIPVVYEGEDHTGVRPHADATTVEVQRWEARRAAGEIEHVRTDTLITQIWCTLCQNGSEVTITEVGAQEEITAG